MAVNEEQWGIFDPVSNIVHVHKEARFNDDDLLDVAATQTLLHGGTVYAVDRAQMPDEGLLAAVFRYKSKYVTTSQRNQPIREFDYNVVYLSIARASGNFQGFAAGPGILVPHAPRECLDRNRDALNYVPSVRLCYLARAAA